MGQIAMLRRRFLAIGGDKGYLSEEDFDRIQRQSEDVGSIETLWGFQLFGAFDRNRTGRVNFEEFVLGFASIQRVAQVGSRVPHSITLNRRSRTHMLEWQRKPRTVLIVKKRRDAEVTAAADMVGKWLQKRGMQVLVEHGVYHSELPHFAPLSYSAPGPGPSLSPDVDFMVSLGGDGTLLHAFSMFDCEEVVPPCVSFGLGSLGFLTPFRISEFEAILEQVIAAHDGEGVAVSLRSRLRCEVFPPEKKRKSTEDPSHQIYRSAERGVKIERGDQDWWLTLPGPTASNAVHVVLNECLIDRGTAPYLCALKLLVDGHEITTVQADGLIIATPSGSTAYSLSAGGSMVAPNVAGTLLTPLAPHTLSFRPLVVDAGAKIEILVPETARATARVTFDGRNMMQVARGGSVRIDTSMCPVPLVSMQPSEWFQSIRNKLNWNVRTEQKALK